VNIHAEAHPTPRRRSRLVPDERATRAPSVVLTDTVDDPVNADRVKRGAA
jgi:hypothetical protein